MSVHFCSFNRSSPNDGPRRAKQHHKERNVVKHPYVPSIVQDRNSFSHSGVMSQQDGQSVYNPSVSQPPHYAQCGQNYIPPVSLMNSGTFLDQSRQNICGGPIPVPIPNRVPSPLLQYPPVHLTQVIGKPAILPHPPGIPLYAMPYSHSSSSSSGQALPSIAHSHPPVTMPAVSEIYRNSSYT